MLSRVIVFPSTFGERIAYLATAHTLNERDSGIDFMMQRLTMYTLQEIWSASLLLIPIQVNHHWLLVAVTNPCQAVSQDVPREGLHNVMPGELKPDREPFTILLLNSSPQYAASTVSKLPAQIRTFLELTWFELRSSALEFVNSYPVKVRQLV